MTLQTNLLTGEKVYLTGMKKDNISSYVEWVNDIDIMRLVNPGLFKPVTHEQEETWYNEARKSTDGTIFAIHTLADDKLIGNISTMDTNWQARHCLVGIMIGEKDYWGKGYGTDAMRIILRYAFMEMNMNRVGLQVFGYNERAIKSYEKVGFVQEAVLRQKLWRDGQYHDEIFMGILRRDWSAQQSGT